MKTLMIDDKRTIVNAEIARNYKEGLEYLEHRGPWDVLYLDHDLGDFQNEREYTGYDILCWLEERHPEYTPQRIIVITQNPSAREKMNVVVKKLER